MAQSANVTATGVAEVLNSHSYEYWLKRSMIASSNVASIWNTVGEGKAVGREVMNIILDFQRIVDAHFNQQG